MWVVVDWAWGRIGRLRVCHLANLLFGGSERNELLHNAVARFLLGCGVEGLWAALAVVSGGLGASSGVVRLWASCEGR